MGTAAQILCACQTPVIIRQCLQLQDLHKADRKGPTADRQTDKQTTRQPDRQWKPNPWFQSHCKVCKNQFRITLPPFHKHLRVACLKNA